MRTAISAFCVLAAAITLSGCSGDESADSKPVAVSSAASAASETPASAAGTPANLTVHAWTGNEHFPVPGVGVRFTSCADDSEVGTATTGRDGNAGHTVTAAGCYRATVTSAPSGCQADEAASGTADVKLDEPVTLEFLIHCA
ncbi:hypothetical protein NWFMUON74_08790 [Nocardia wallacei]|uniref:Lipoprotein n=1 Tax=Nocardia wallacei TaxID=480035 RepID=A0A7G1KD08_9NOCA|nr:hypothetical protein [Nocardia wallacei]BCK53107.1 hypothetical protein NWFMUON74_08790 [Nocardia wallacei]